jgi:hypothetical protein
MARPKSGYRNKEGKKVVGVTTPIGRFKDSGGLLWWAFEQGKLAEQGEINSLYDKRDESGESGTLAHEMVEDYIDGGEGVDTSNYSDEIIKQAEQGFENYLNWQENNKIEVVRQEIPLVSEKYQFGGALDGVGYDGQRRRILVDWKTSNKVYPDHIIQIAAYGKLWEENYPNDPITGGYHLCRFSKENADFAHYHFSELDDAWEQFKLFLQCYQIDKLLKRRV